MSMSMSVMSCDNVNTILSFLEPRDLINVRGVCKFFFQTSKNPAFWKAINIGHFNSNMSRVMELFKCVFITEDEPNTELFTAWCPPIETIIIPSSVTSYTVDDFTVLTELCPFVKKFSLEYEEPEDFEDDEDFEDLYEHEETLEQYNKRTLKFYSKVPSGILDKLQVWSLESVEFIGEGSFNVTQDYLEPFFQSQPSLKYFRCDFDIALFLVGPPSDDHELVSIASHGSRSIAYYAALYCKELRTFRAQAVDIERHMLRHFEDLEEVPFAEASLRACAFENATEAASFAKCFTSLEILHLNFLWDDVDYAVDHMSPFVSSLPCIRVLNITKDIPGNQFGAVPFQSSTLEAVNILLNDL